MPESLLYAKTRRLALWAETLPLAIVAGVLVVVGVLSLHTPLIDVIHPSSYLHQRAAVIRVVLLGYGIGFVSCFLASAALIRYGHTTLTAEGLRLARSVVAEMRSIVHSARSLGRDGDTALWLAAITAVGAVVRSYFLAQPMRYDESFTFLSFVNKGLRQLFYYPLPNNHVLHTILVRASVALFGSHPVAIRLPAVVAGLCVIPLAFCLARSLFGRSAGLLTSSLVAVFPYLILFDTMARGYSLLVCLTLGVTLLIMRSLRRPSAGLCFLAALVTALGLLDMPSFLFPAAGLYLWALVMRSVQGQKAGMILTRWAVPAGVMTGFLTVLFYTPTIIASNGVHTLVANRVVKGVAMPEFVQQLPTHVWYTVRQFSRDVPWPVLAGGLVLAFAGVGSMAWKRLWSGLILIPALVLGGAIVLFAQHAIPYDRTWIYGLPFGFLLADAGFMAVTRSAGAHVKGVLLLLAGCSAVLLMNHNVIAAYPDTGYFPEAKSVVEALAGEMRPQDQIVVRCPADWPLRFYLWALEVPRRSASADAAAQPRKFLVVRRNYYSLAELTGGPTRKLWEFGEAEVYVAE